MSNCRANLASICASVWLGVSLGANLVAAPAKFTVTTLSIPDLVSVGRAQFTWVGGLELFLAATLSLVFFTAWKRTGSALRGPSLLLLALVICLCVQRFILHPQLQTNASHMLHVLYVVIECLKAAGLVSFILYVWKAAK